MKAVECVPSNQLDMAARSYEVQEDRRIEFRQGISLGDLAERREVLGNGLGHLGGNSRWCGNAGIFWLVV